MYRFAAASLLLLAGVPGLVLAEPPAEGAAESREALMQRLDQDNWVPSWLKSHASLFDPTQQDPLLAETRREPFQMVAVGDYSYRTSPARVELGRRLFETYDWGTTGLWRPALRFIFYALDVDSLENLETRFGILADRRGRLIGLTGMRAADGRIDYGWTCALCHTGLDSRREAVPGSPNHRLDYGRIYSLGLVEHPSHPAVIGPMLDRDTPLGKLGSLGRGRIDINADRISNAVKIPSLWGLRASQSGMFANGSVDNVWMGIAHNGGPFPSSDLLEAVVAYVLSLEPPPNPRAGSATATPGKGVFERANCASCHSGPYYTNGQVIPLDVIGTDPERVVMELPKGYRVPSLRRLDLQQLFLHDGSIRSLERLFSRDRLRTVPGHEYGLDLPEKEKQQLVAFLLSL